MNQYKQLLYKIFQPSKRFVYSGIVLTMVLMGYVFLGNHKKEALAYITYILSAYALILVCVQLRNYLKKRSFSFFLKNKYMYCYIKDPSFRFHIALCRSLIMNVIYVMFNVCIGLSYGSIWSITLAVYYCFLAIMRFLLLRHINYNTSKSNMKSELKLYRFYGSMLLLLNIVLAGVMTLVLHQNKGFHYGGSFIYVMAIYAFYAIIMAIINVIKYRKQSSPVVSASKAINFVVALVAMFSLETAMLSEFGTAKDVVFGQLITSITGTMVCSVVFAIAIFMIIYASVNVNFR